MAKSQSEITDWEKVVIEQARLSRSRTLTLSGGRLESIPDEVFELVDLEELDLSGNNIRAAPETICRLGKLKRLVLSLNPIESVPDVPGLVLDWDAYLRCRHTLSPANVRGIWVRVSGKSDVRDPSLLVPELTRLPQLSELTMYNPQRLWPTDAVLNLIAFLGDFSSLEALGLSGILLGEVPTGIRNLPHLRSLSIDRAGLRNLPDWVSELVELTTLSAYDNNLERLPDSLQNLHSLSRLNIASNRFTEFPAVVFPMETLTELFIQTSPGPTFGIRQIPAGILNLKNLKTLDVRGHPIETPPPEVVRRGVEDIKNYWRQGQEAGIDYLCEAKLLIVGEPGAGKTSLAKKIENPVYQLQPAETTTKGIEITRYRFTTAIRVKDQEKLIERDFQVNIWDFGGQEVYHATHQFFLTRRSVYALVADDRKEDTDFNYWLNVVELLSDACPVFIVQNEKQDRRRDIDLSSLRARFANLKGSLRVNLADNRGLRDLTAAIRSELERLPHIGTPLPTTWKRVREALETDQRNYIGLEQYLAVCDQHGFTRREDKLQLSGYLHDLGICLHFQDDPVLKQTVILKPKWGTDAVYKALDDAMVIEHHGRFTRADLARIWSEPTYADMRDELLSLMMKFELCYELPEGNAYIAPQRLPLAQPAYEWSPADNLVLRYDYDFMPKGILTRFIVALSHLIADQGLTWKSGVITEREGTRAEVIEDYEKRNISVRLAGPDTRGLLAIIDDQLERIHRTLPRLKYEKRLPCSCEECRTSPEPFLFPLTDLKRFVAKGKRIQCHNSGDTVDAAELIRDIFPAARVRDEAFHRPEPEVAKEVFVSYAWNDESNKIVGEIEEGVKGSGIIFRRDQSELKYKDSILDFMRRIGRGDRIVVVISDKYLKSPNCMFELTEIVARGDLASRMFPRVLSDANIYSLKGRLGYVEYWEKEKAEIEAILKRIGSENLTGAHAELDVMARIRATIDGIETTLKNMNNTATDEELIDALKN